MRLTMIISPLLALLPSVLAAPTCQTSRVAASDITNSPNVPINTSPLLPFQSPALTTINSTAWEYWYFDGVSASTRAGITIVFFRDPSLAPLGLGPLRIAVDAVWENGTRFTSMIFHDESVVQTCGDVTKGRWTGPQSNSSFEFRGGNSYAKIDLSGTSITGDAVSGTFILRSFSKPRYPGGESYPNAKASVQLAPLIYWNEGVPAGDVTTNVVLKGTPLKFSGIGGTDRNFAPYIWDYLAKEWWWIRTVTGPYAWVYWKFVSAIDGKAYSYAYLEQSGVPIFKSSVECSATITTNCAVFGRTYDGTVKGQFADQSTGFDVEFKVKGKSWKFDVEHRNVVFEAYTGSNNEYTRFVNWAKGGEVKGTQFEGASKSEQNRIVVSPPIL
ncbi:hypothetical protein K458DRAFT_413912 [Lentithecium fluviatile CBS 122367]|uniref:AttH domain-containing protein n=1 Tax=Lentithecium fluviatile CBS 122367 TaxID=1168545 RepID=A0A6G1JHF1_9PLEO|nr:hypothetical protein K458DRAFT_413912 [Lentithecium fluviatile CBS 122367]